MGDQTENKQRGKRKGTHSRSPFLAPDSALPSRADEEREKGKALPEGQLCKERWIFPGSRANWLYQTDFFFFFSELPGCTNCLVHSHLASCPNPGSPGAAALTHPSSTDFPQGAPHLAVPSHTLQVALQFSLEPTVIFPKAIYICMNCGKEKQMQYLVKQYQIHQFCAPL